VSGDSMNGSSCAAWRFIDTGPLTAGENMAIDEALLDCFVAGESSPALRTYGWSPPAFSYGRFQKPEEIIDLDRCCADGIQVVRRITGGGVIYHANELTYSLVCPSDFLAASSGVKAAFFRLTAFLTGFYRNLGLPACHAVEHYPDSKRLGERTPLCFAGVESCDIVINGRKIGGNAQRRLKKVIFQHGSIPLQQMAENGNRYLLHPDRDVAERTTALDILGVKSGRESLAELLKASFEESFGVVLNPACLSEREQCAAGEHMQNIA